MKLGKTQERVLDYLRRNGPTEVETIAEALRLSKAAVRGACMRMFTLGLTMASKQSYRNTWSATPTELTPPPTHTPPLHGELPSA